jgi:hypothetical protein
MSHWKTLRTSGPIPAALLWFLAEEARACSVCYGAAESPMLDGLNVSILVLLGITYFVVGSFAVFFVHVLRREQLFTGDERLHPEKKRRGL